MTSRNGRVKRTMGAYNEHPSSLFARAGKDPDLRRRLEEGRRRSVGDARAMERWARRGCLSEAEML